MGAQGAQVQHPQDRRQVGRADLLRGASGGKPHRRRLHPLGHRFGRALLVEGVAVGFSLLTRDDPRPPRASVPWSSTVLQRGQNAGPHAEEILGHLQLVESQVRKVRLGGAGDAHAASVHVQLDGGLRHAAQTTHLPWKDRAPSRRAHATRSEAVQDPRAVASPAHAAGVPRAA